MQFYSFADRIKKQSELSSRNAPKQMDPGVVPPGEHGALLPIALLGAQNLLGKQDRETHKCGDKAQC